MARTSHGDTDQMTDRTWVPPIVINGTELPGYWSTPDTEDYNRSQHWAMAPGHGDTTPEAYKP